MMRVKRSGRDESFTPGVMPVPDVCLRKLSYFTTTFTSKYFDPSLSMVPSAFRSVSA
ncbi:hypothetical protein ABH944_005022 [Caballeronia udeis]|uniref:Uncharacterized protein n=1 Tax=Caballeronia udeis TaxID=1232866 RepID=A0ABW8MMH0_9BURK